jgi:hypothetical protein
MLAWHGEFLCAELKVARSNHGATAADNGQQPHRIRFLAILDVV